MSSATAVERVVDLRHAVQRADLLRQQADVAREVPGAALDEAVRVEQQLAAGGKATVASG